MKYIKKYEELNIIDFLSGKSRRDDLESKSKLLGEIFNNLKKDGYDFILVRKPGDSISLPGGLSKATEWIYKLKSLDGVPPLFQNLLSSDFKFSCGRSKFKIEPYIPGLKKGYSDYDLRKDFPNTDFDPYDPDVVEKIKNFIDQFELKVLK